MDIRIRSVIKLELEPVRVYAHEIIVEHTVWIEHFVQINIMCGYIPAAFDQFQGRRGSGAAKIHPGTDDPVPIANDKFSEDAVRGCERDIARTEGADRRNEA